MGLNSCRADYNERALLCTFSSSSIRVRVSADERPDGDALLVSLAPGARNAPSAFSPGRRQAPAHGCGHRSANDGASAGRAPAGGRGSAPGSSGRCRGRAPAPSGSGPHCGRPAPAGRIRRGVSASPAFGEGGGEVAEHRRLGAAQHVAQQRRQQAAIEGTADWFGGWTAHGLSGKRRLFGDQTNSASASDELQGPHRPGRPHHRRSDRRHHPGDGARCRHRLPVRLPVGQLRRLQVAPREGRGDDGRLFRIRPVRRGESARPHPRLPRRAVGRTAKSPGWRRTI